MRKLYLAVLFFIISVSNSLSSPVIYPNMPVACLPDRAQQDQMAACHCPPVEMCGEMPDYVAQRCCPKQEFVCMGGYPNSPAVLDSCPYHGETRDINGNCCSDSVKKDIVFKSWHVRQRNFSYFTARINDIEPNNLNRNWLRKWMPEVYRKVPNFLIEAETGDPRKCIYDANGNLIAPCINYDQGDVVGKICPQDELVEKYRSSSALMNYLTSKYVDSPWQMGSQVCDSASFALGGYVSSSNFTNCCILPIPSETTCLAPDTMVLMADGSEKMIQKIVKGDVVKGKTSNNVVQEVVILTLDNRDMYSLNDGVLKLTAEHPIMTAEGWKSVNGDAEKAKLKYNLDSVGVLKIGDELVTKDGKIRLEKMEKLPLEDNTTTFNLKLDGDETFYAGGLLVKDN